MPLVEWSSETVLLRCTASGSGNSVQGVGSSSRVTFKSICVCVNEEALMDPGLDTGFLRGGGGGGGFRRVAEEGVDEAEEA